MRVREQTYSFIIWRKLNSEFFPWHCSGLLSRRQTLGTFQAEKLKPITHTARPRMKSRKLGIWQEGKRSKTGNWLGQTRGKSRQPTRSLMEVPIRQPLPLHPTLSPGALQLGGFISEELCQHLSRETQSEHVLPSDTAKEAQVACWKRLPWEGKKEATTASAPDLGLRKLNSTEQILQAQSWARESPVKKASFFEKNRSSVFSCLPLLKHSERQTH